ncbi:MAG TPA: hypothetical protein VFS24_20000 [Steroidobacteraceae bacterium]|nr:hypothetical protein [Steroidobacteraceae bacterium]
MARSAAARVVLFVSRELQRASVKFLSATRLPNLELVRRAWREYAFNSGSPSSDVRPYVNRAWRRSRALGCDPQLRRAETLNPAATAKIVAERKELRQPLEPFLLSLSRAAGSAPHAAMLTDEYGHLLQIVGDEKNISDEGFRHPGSLSLLSEAALGANGVGTALAEDAYVELVGPEHFVEEFHSFTCQGVPVHGPNGHITAVLSMLVRRLETADRVRDILFCASEAAECELLADWLAYSDDAAQAATERVREDILQKLATAPFRLDEAAQRSTGGSAGDPLDAAVKFARNFRRRAHVWRTLATEENHLAELDRIDFTDLVAEFIDLLQIEARVALVRLTWGSAERLAVLDAPTLLPKKLLAVFLSAIQESTAGAAIEANVFKEDKRAKLHVRGMNSGSGNARSYVVTAPLAS